MFYIEETTIGFTPDKYKFNKYSKAVDAIFAIAEGYRKDKTAYNRMVEFKNLLNIDGISWKYSERWIIEAEADGIYLQDFEDEYYINREHFADGSCIVTIDRERKFGNYKK